jgi:hypothetical protein
MPQARNYDCQTGRRSRAWRDEQNRRSPTKTSRGGSGLSRLKDWNPLLTLVDGTLLTAVPRTAAASLLKQQTGSGQVKWRLAADQPVDRPH